MAKGLDWTLKLIDKMSGPAAKINSTLDKLEAKLKSARDVGAEWLEGFETVGASFIAKIAKGTFDLVRTGAQMAIDASSFKEDSISAFEAILHSRQAAADVFDQVDELAGRLGLDDAAAIDKMRQLMASGFSSEQAIRILEQTANVAAARGDAAADKFATVIATFEAKGKFDTAVLNQMAKAGIRVEDVYQALATKLGKTIDQVRAMAKAGQIDAAAGVDAIMAATEKAFGGAAAKKAETFSKLLFRVKDALGDLFQDVDLTPLKDLLKNLLSALNGPAGEGLKNAISSFFGSLFKILASTFQGPEGQKKLERFLNTMTNAILMAGEILEKHGPFIVKTLDQIFTLLGSNKGGGGGEKPWWQKAIEFLADFGLKLMAGDIVGTIDMVVDALRDLFGFDEVPRFSELLEQIKAQLSEWWDSLFGGGESAGNSIVSGIISGIQSASGALFSTLMALGSRMLTTFMASIDAHSPSRAFADVGAFIPQGAAMGVENDNSAQDAVDNMVVPPSASAARGVGAAAAAGLGSGGGKVITLNIAAVTVNGGGPVDFEEGFSHVVEMVAEAVGA